MGGIAYRSLGSILQAVHENCQRANDGHYPKFKTKAIEAINRALDSAASASDWKELTVASDLGLRVQGDTTLPMLMAASAYFVAPWRAMEVLSVQLTDPSRINLVELPAAELALKISDVASTGAPCFYAPWDSTVMNEPLAASGVVTVLCNRDGNDTDDGARVVRVWYQKIGYQFGDWQFEDVRGDFSTGVALSASVAAGWSVKQVNLPSGWVGNLTMQDASANVLVTLHGQEVPTTIGSTEDRIFTRSLYRLDRATDVDRTGIMVWRRAPVRLQDDEDAPDIPVGSYLVDMATATIKRQQNDHAAAREFERSAQGHLEDAIAARLPRDRGSRPLHGNPLDGNGVHSWRGGWMR